MSADPDQIAAALRYVEHELKQLKERLDRIEAKQVYLEQILLEVKASPTPVRAVKIEALRR